MIIGIIKLAMTNFTLTLLILGFIAALIAISVKAKPRSRGVVIEALFSYFILFSVAVNYFYNFIMHVFYGDMVAKFIGWAPSPFQAEVGYASLGFAVIGLLAFKGSRGLRIAAVLGPAFFCWGAAGGHVYQMIKGNDFAPGNAGVIFYTDIFLPIIGIILLFLSRKKTRF